jgi:NTE family protein
LVPLSGGIALAELARDLSKALSRIGLRSAVLDRAPARFDLQCYGNIGESNDLVIYQADAESGPWTRLCIRQSDRVLAVADASGPEPLQGPICSLLPRDRPGVLELLMVHRGQGFSPPAVEELAKNIGAGFHTHVRLGRHTDFDRLARLLAGRAVGVVLSGGGARGFAHLGVIQALSEAGVPIDMVAGTSMGALVAAGAAVERDALREEMREAFLVRNPLSDFTLPIVSIFRGRRTSRLLREHGRGLRVGDCWRPFFCTSSNLSSGAIRVHREGPLWMAVRASLAIPGVLPPVIDHGEVLVDGGILNNLPADVMMAMRRGPVIAVDVCRKSSFTATVAGELENLPLWKMLSRKRRGVPNILALLMRAGTISSQAQVRALEGKVDLLIEPKLEGMGMLDWHAFDRAVEAGYRQTLQQLENDQRALRRLSSTEAAVGP